MSAIELAIAERTQADQHLLVTVDSAVISSYRTHHENGHELFFSVNLSQLSIARLTVYSLFWMPTFLDSR